MRAAALCLAVGGMLVGACSTPVDVASEARYEIPPDTTAVDHTDEQVTASTTTTTTTTTQPEPVPYDDPARGVLPAELLLMAGDVDGWNITGPRSTSAGSYPPARDCPLVDVVRSVDRQTNIGTMGGSGSSGFYNMLIQLGSVGEATAVLDAAEQAWIDCPTFTDSGPGRLEPLDVPDGGWRAAGLMIATTEREVYIGYWQLGSTIVKLRVLGPDARATFPELAEAVARKLTSAGTIDETIPDDAEPSDSIDSEDDPFYIEEDWDEHPLAALVLEPYELGASWDRMYVGETDLGPGDVLGCGVGEPDPLPGLSAGYFASDPEVSFAQLVGEGEESAAQAWVETLRVLATCVDPASGYEFAPLTLAPGTAGADDLAGLVISSGTEEYYPFVSTWIVARYGTFLVATSWTVEGAETATSMPPIDEMVRVFELAAPG